MTRGVDLVSDFVGKVQDVQNLGDLYLGLKAGGYVVDERSRKLFKTPPVVLCALFSFTSLTRQNSSKFHYH